MITAKWFGTTHENPKGRSGVKRSAPWSAMLMASALLATGRLEAQVTGSAAPKAQASRQQLQETLAQIDQLSNSTGYSSRIRNAKRAEATLLRDRLAEGDLQVGDQVVLTVVGEPNLTGTFAVSAGRVLQFAGLPEIPLRGVLRSEVQDYLTTQLQKYLKDPTIRVQTMIRLSVLGAVGKPGFYQISADQLVGDAIMLAGGPSGNTDVQKTVVRRAGTEIVPRESFADGLTRGLTLDQLNLRAGDEIVLGAKGSTNQLLQLGVPILSLTMLILRAAKVY